MIYKDIVNRDIVNLENCEDEPIHIPGLIQPHGFLIAANNENGIISVCSENINNYLDFDYKEVLGKDISQIFQEDFINKIELFQTGSNSPLMMFDFVIKERLFSFTVHNNDSEIIIEGEPTEDQFINNNKLYNSSKQLLSYIEDTSTLKELANSVAIAIKNITQYDRVMVYRFDSQYNGEVFAESKEEHLEPFLGLHYPHTDIPVQARELYIKNLLRIIGDVDYNPVPLYTFQDSNVQTLDIGQSVLRSVSPIHIQYLKNMGVGATLTISLLYQGKLWGLITCHHYSPKYINQEIRNTVKLHGHFITSQIDVRMLNEQYEVSLKGSKNVDQLTSKKLNFNRKSIKSLFDDKAIIDLCNSSGVSAIIGDNIYTHGETPKKEHILMLCNTLHHYSHNGKLVTQSLSRITSDLPLVSNEFPGINYQSLGNENDCIIWYRHTTLKDIHWAGDPSKAIEKDKNGLSPRKSFKKFTENVSDSSKPWLQSEIDASIKFFNFFQTHLRSILVNEEKENQQKLSAILKEANDELENINWISTHDLQEPLRKIRMMASSIIMKGELTPLPDDVQNKILRMQHSAERMQTLITDILKYTKANVQNNEFEPVDINLMLVSIKQELKDSLGDVNAKLVLEPLPLVEGMPFLLKQVFLNIIYNSLKFRSKSRHPIIKISANEDTKNGFEKYSLIEIEDNGIGFDNQYKDKVFKIFSRLNNKSDYPGSGVGLALCKKIMTKHNGFINATGVLGKGTTIQLYFPRL